MKRFKAVINGNKIEASSEIRKLNSGTIGFQEMQSLVAVLDISRIGSF